MIVRPIYGQVFSKVGECLSLLSETGRVFDIKTINTTLSIGDEVFIAFDYINNKVANVLKVGESDCIDEPEINGPFMIDMEEISAEENKTWSTNYQCN